jgi:hypothetical protein
LCFDSNLPYYILIIGTVGTITAFPGSGLTSGAWPENQCSGYGTAIVGSEIVYDFRHQQRAFFSYRASGETIGTVAQGSIGIYRGFASNFVHGVQDYEGRAVSHNISANFLKIINAGVSGSVPFNSDGTVNPEGVYSLHYNLGLGGGLGAPVNLAISQAFYKMDRNTLIDYNGIGPQEDLIQIRQEAATPMADELLALSHVPVFDGSAIDSLNKWVKYR